MRILVLIPARGGSKGVPRKNLRRLAGVPLFVHSVEAALELQAARPEDDVRIVVSSDDLDIVMRAADCGRGVMGMVRPDELATDTASTDDVIVHALEAMQREHAFSADLVVLLQPTVPLRSPGLVNAAVERLLQAGADSLLTAYRLHFVWWRETPEADVRGRVWRTQCSSRPRRQEMEERELMLHEDGSVFVSRVELLARTGKRIGGRVEVLETARTVDIDTEEDLVLAEALIALRGRAGQLQEGRV